MKHRTAGGGIFIALSDVRRGSHPRLRVLAAKAAFDSLRLFRDGQSSGSLASGPFTMSWGAVELDRHLFTLSTRFQFTRSQTKAIRRGLADAGLHAQLAGDGKFYAVVSDYSAVAA